MSVDSKLFVTCKKEDVLSIGRAVEESLNTYVRGKLDEYWKNNTRHKNRIQFLIDKKLKKESHNFTNGISIECMNFDVFVMCFGNGDGGNRSLYMFPTCSDDYNGVADGYKIIFSIGLWGSSEEIMMVVAEAIKEFGEVYYDFNDCDDLGFIKL